jgi:hypothetical protein
MNSRRLVCDPEGSKLARRELNFSTPPVVLVSDRVHKSGHHRNDIAPGDAWEGHWVRWLAGACAASPSRADGQAGESAAGSAGPIQDGSIVFVELPVAGVHCGPSWYGGLGLAEAGLPANTWQRYRHNLACFTMTNDTISARAAGSAQTQGRCQMR